MQVRCFFPLVPSRVPVVIREPRVDYFHCTVISHNPILSLGRANTPPHAINLRIPILHLSVNARAADELSVSQANAPKLILIVTLHKECCQWSRLQQLLAKFTLNEISGMPPIYAVNALRPWTISPFLKLMRIHNANPNGILDVAKNRFGPRMWDLSSHLLPNT